ncbi:hypothetical protein [Streptomyces sp. NPDC048106]|uniref:hypothetical protein n=1 Tax=Streptomyces sp. NPDC048106 TaxID=3155750 RepID=UPI0034564F75
MRRIRRAGEVLYANELTPQGHWRHPVGAREALLAERLRPWSAAQTGVFRRQLAEADRRAHDPRLPEDWSLAVRRDAERAAALAEPLRRTAQMRREAELFGHEHQPLQGKTAKGSLSAAAGFASTFGGYRSALTRVPATAGRAP